MPEAPQQEPPLADDIQHLLTYIRDVLAESVVARLICPADPESRIALHTERITQWWGAEVAEFIAGAGALAGVLGAVRRDGRIPEAADPGFLLVDWDVPDFRVPDGAREAAAQDIGISMALVEHLVRTADTESPGDITGQVLAAASELSRNTDPENPDAALRLAVTMAVACDLICDEAGIPAVNPS